MYLRKNILIFFNLCACLFVVTKCEVCKDVSPSYYYSSVYLSCTNLIDKFPQFTKSVQSLKCIDCKVPILDETTNIKNFKGDIFNLTNSHVKRLEATAFKFFTNSTHRFIFDDNEINYIAPKTFSNFSMLDDISLRNNKLYNTGDKLFEKANASTLDLSQNHFKKIDGLFLDFRVSKLNLSSNELTELPANAFENVIFWPGRQWRHNYQSLDLSKNYIEELVLGTFKFSSSESSLRLLSLSQNRLTRIANETFVELTLLTTLNLEDNVISDLESKSFKGLSMLNTLKLRNNNIQTIPRSLFADLERLEFLDLSMNNLVDLNANTFTGLFNLYNLNISHNNLRVLEENDLLPLGKLSTLDISDTRIHDLNLHSIFDHNHKLRTLVLNDNFWTCKQLVDMYKLLNEKASGFSRPAKYYDVPNLHGIACSRNPLDTYDDLTLEDFLGIISQDRVFEDLFDSRVSNVYDGISLQDVNNTMRSLRGIYYMFIVLLVIVLILFTHFVVKNVYVYVYNRNIVANDKISFAYRPNQDNVELL